jgi:hypothetical protein
MYGNFRESTSKIYQLMQKKKPYQLMKQKQPDNIDGRAEAIVPSRRKGLINYMMKTKRKVET